jgi:hypothetical protein
MVVVSSRSSSPTSRKKYLIVIEDFGWPTRKMNYILTMALTRHNVSTPRRLAVYRAKFNFLEAHSLNWYRFIGRILGKALYEGILVEVAFAGFFLAKVCFCHLFHPCAGTYNVADTSGWASRVSWTTSPHLTLICIRV